MTCNPLHRSRDGQESSQRRVDDFLRFLPPLIRRVGLYDGRLVATRHNGIVTRADWLVTSHVSQNGILAPDASLRVVSLQELDYWLRHVFFPFGQLRVGVAKGQVKKLTFNVFARPDERDTLGHLFCP